MKNKGFTLIEIMVVVAIIIILVSIAILAGTSARSIARDNERVNNIAILRLKLEAYRDQKGVYPPTLDKLVSEKYISSIPVGTSGHEYKYAGEAYTSGGACTDYHLGVLFETKSSALDKAVKKVAGNSCIGGGVSSVPFNANVPFGNATDNLWYDVVSPK